MEATGNREESVSALLWLTTFESRTGTTQSEDVTAGLPDTAEEVHAGGVGGAAVSTGTKTRVAGKVEEGEEGHVGAAPAAARKGRSSRLTGVGAVITPASRRCGGRLRQAPTERIVNLSSVITHVLTHEQRGHMHHWCILLPK